MERAFVLLLLVFVLASTAVLPGLQPLLSYNTPSFMMQLYECVNRSSPLKCYGVDAKSVWSLAGSYQKTNSSLTNSTVIQFNTSKLATSVSRQEALLTAEIRIHRRSLSQSDIDLLDASGCCSSVKVQLLTSSERGESADVDVVSTATFRPCKASVEQWVGFCNATSLYTAWARDRRSKFQTLTLAVTGACGPELLGFSDDGGHEPLLVAYFTRPSAEGLDVISGAISTSLATLTSSTAKRDVGPCTLQLYQIDLAALGLSNYYPPTLQANLCRGQCTAPLTTSDPLYATDHAAFQYYLSVTNTAIPPPSCVPLGYAVYNFLIYDASTVILTTSPKAIATSCQCA